LAIAGILAVLVLVGGLLPTLFFKPIEASTQATRLMATNPVGQRPVWTDANQEISMKAGEVGALLKNGQVIAPGKLHLLPSRPLGSVATTTGGEE
jgi:hypothetical protein